MIIIHTKIIDFKMQSGPFFQTLHCIYRSVCVDRV